MKKKKKQKSLGMFWFLLYFRIVIQMESLVQWRIRLQLLNVNVIECPVNSLSRGEREDKKKEEKEEENVRESQDEENEDHHLVIIFRTDMSMFFFFVFSSPHSQLLFLGLFFTVSSSSFFALPACGETKPNSLPTQN